MSTLDVVVLQTLLDGVELPADKGGLIRHATREGATPTQLGLLDRLPDRRFDTLDEVREELSTDPPARAS